MFFRLILFWFLYMAGLGTFFPFFSLYLETELHLSGTQVGLVIAVLPAIGIFTQPMWGRLADHTGSRRGVLAGIVFGAACGYSVIGLADDFQSVLLAVAVLAVFATSVLPMATAVTLASVGEKGASGFGWVRMWGTLGFLALVVGFPHFLGAWRGSSWDGALPWQGLGILFLVSGSLSALAAGVACVLPATEGLRVRSEPGDTRRLFEHQPVRRLLIWIFLGHLCMQGPMALFPLFVTTHGGDLEVISGMWLFMLLVEIPLIGFSGRFLKRIGARGLITLGLLTEGIRWTSCAFIDDLEIIRWIQMLHGFGVAGVLVGGPLYLEQAVPERLRSTGQALVSTAGYGLGTIFSTIACGWLFDNGGANAPYTIAGATLLLLAALTHTFLPEPLRPPSDHPSSA